MDKFVLNQEVLMKTDICLMYFINISKWDLFILLKMIADNISHLLVLQLKEIIVSDCRWLTLYLLS